MTRNIEQAQGDWSRALRSFGPGSQITKAAHAEYQEARAALAETMNVQPDEPEQPCPGCLGETPHILTCQDCGSTGFVPLVQS